MAADSGAQLQVLLCQAGPRLCALPLDHVVETLRALPVQPCVGVPAFVCGVSIIRGAPVPVVDLENLLAGAAATERDRWVTLRVQERSLALGVDRVLGIRTIATSSLAALPRLLQGEGAAPLSSLASIDSQLLGVLDAARLVPESVWALLLAREEHA